MCGVITAPHLSIILYKNDIINNNYYNEKDGYLIIDAFVCH